MTANPEPTPSIRLWPAVLLLASAVAAFVVFPIIEPRSKLHFAGGFGTPVFNSIAVLIWWLVGSRTTGFMRWLPVVLFLAAAGINIGYLNKDVPFSVILFGFPFAGGLWVLWLIVSRVTSREVQLAGLVGVIAGAWGLFSMVRIGEMNAEIEPEIEWRWKPSKMDTFKEDRAKWAAALPGTAEIKTLPGDWAEFRGAKRDSSVTGVSIETNWSANPPKLLWKHRIGPGWGTFSVVGDKLFTQEQVEDEQEAVVCYEAETGKPVWEYKYNARFFEGIAGVGPRGTPTVTNGRVYTFGATGKLVCLDASKGTKIWERDVATDTGAKVQQWGYSSSPLVFQGVVVVFANGPSGKGTAAYQAETGEPAWTAGNGTLGYCSAHIAKFGGVDQILMISDVGIESYQPKDGKILWIHDWPVKGVNRVSQPAILSDTDLLIGTGVGNDQGTRRVRVTKTGDTWKTETVWNSKNMKPYFNDGVIHNGYFYGFDDKSLACIDLTDGSKKWKTGTQYGHGQLLLLADQGLLVVQAVDGKVALVEANPSDHNEIAKFPALGGKTWNHPVVANGKLFVRNAIEAAAYELKKK
jgi:outer membrane protein assembly factor BamB